MTDLNKRLHEHEAKLALLEARVASLESLREKGIDRGEALLFGNVKGSDDDDTKQPVKEEKKKPMVTGGALEIAKPRDKQEARAKFDVFCKADAEGKAAALADLASYLDSTEEGAESVGSLTDYDTLVCFWDCDKKDCLGKMADCLGKILRDMVRHGRSPWTLFELEEDDDDDDDGYRRLQDKYRHLRVGRNLVHTILIKIEGKARGDTNQVRADLTLLNLFLEFLDLNKKPETISDYSTNMTEAIKVAFRLDKLGLTVSPAVEWMEELDPVPLVTKDTYRALFKWPSLRTVLEGKCKAAFIKLIHFGFEAVNVCNLAHTAECPQEVFNYLVKDYKLRMVTRRGNDVERESKLALEVANLKSRFAADILASQWLSGGNAPSGW